MGKTGGSGSVGKRLFDVVFALAGLLILFPLLGIVALVVIIGDGRPVLYRDGRVGPGGTLFSLLKFRTLKVGAEASPHVAAEDDARITRTGLWLRRWRVDELPQLVNVLRGEMSPVGPRPLPPNHAASLPEEVRAELAAVKPGVTDPAAIAFLAEDAVLAGRDDAESVYLETLLPAKVAIQLEYARGATLLSDMWVVTRTLALMWSPGHRRRSAERVRGLIGS